MKDIKLNERAVEIGEIITNRLQKLMKEHSEIGDVRGLGAMVGMELVVDGDPRQPNGELCSRIVKGCAKENLVLLSAGTFKNVIRILAPLVISKELLNKGLDILENVMNGEIKK